jgi:carbamoyl-phosphate synthase large subunit
MSEQPRVLVTGAGGPSGITILRAMAGEPVTMLAADLDPYAAGLYLMEADQRSLLPRGDAPHFAPHAVDLPAIVKPRSGSGSRGIRLVERIPELEALPRDGTLLVQEHLPGPEFSLDVLARSDGRVVGVVPRERLKVDSGIAVTGRTLHDDGLETFARKVAETIGLTTVANVQVKQDAAGVPALLEVNPRFPGTMPLTIAAGIDMPRLAIHEALGGEIPDGPLPFEDIAMVRYFEERFFPFDDIAALQHTAARVSG